MIQSRPREKRWVQIIKYYSQGLKSLQILWTVTRKFYRKILIFDFRSVEQESSSDRDIQKLHDFFLTISIDRAKASIDKKCLTSNFHLENFRIWIFTLWNNILQTQISLLQPIHVYTYIYNINYLPVIWNLTLYPSNVSLVKVP